LAYNTKMIKTDVDKKPIPQIYNPVNDEYEVLQGANGAARHILYSPDGNPITTTGDKLAVRASEVETLLNDIKGKDFATQTTLSQILAKIITAPATEAKQTAIELILNSLDGKDYSTLAKQNEILTKLAALETKLNSALDVQLSGSNIEQLATNYGKIKIETLVNAIPVVAGGRTPSSAWVNYRNEGASQVWVMINIDKYPWTLETGQGVHYNEGVASGRAYPLYVNVNKAYATTYAPATAILLPFQLSTSMGLPESLTWTEALQFAGPLYDGQQITIKNSSTETATITVRIVKIWR
jgi:hypothetical protein